MCGIAGIVCRYSRENIDLDLQKMTDSIEHRGPDGEGHWFNKVKSVGLGHRRLSILDLSDAGNQPMPLDNLIITFNGEIYNYLEIRQKLESKGFSFISNSDTEVLLAGYKYWGEKVLSMLDGMFSFAIYDNESGSLFCARDRFGEKPFYYFHDSNQFLFASEMKALFATGVDKTVDDEMLFYYLAYDIVENPNNKNQTFYDGIKQLPGSHYLKLDNNGSIEIKKYWDIDLNVKLDCSVESASKRFTELFDESIKRRMRSDVSVGSSLSGGIDSSSVLASILTLFPDSNFHTFTARFDDQSVDEGNFIDILEKQYNFKRFECYPKNEQILSDLDKVFYHQEEPFGSTSIIAQWEVMRLAKSNNVTVLLDGQGADETLAGYFKYFNPYLAELHQSSKTKFKTELNLIQQNLGIKSVLSQSELRRFKAPRLYDWLSDTTRKFRNSSAGQELNRDFRNSFISSESPFHRNTNLNEFLYNDLFKYGLGKLLRFADRNSMAHSREVRLPYLSHELVEFVFSLPSSHKMGQGWNKLILRKSMESRLPAEITYRKDKKGFQPPSKWTESDKIVDLVQDSKSLLIRNRYINEESTIDNWQLIMAAKTLTN